MVNQATVRLRVQPWQLAALLILMCSAVIGAVYFQRTHSFTRPEELASYLPTKNSMLVYIDGAAIRKSGLMKIVAGSRAAEELEYQQFVDQTLFDYRQDLDAVAAAIEGKNIYFLLRGRFHWRNLMEYAVKQGGTCHNGFCSVAGSRPDRFISFYPIKSDLMAMAVSDDNTAAYAIKSQDVKLKIAVPQQPVWVLIPATVLEKPDALPQGMRPFAAVLKNAEEVLFALGPEADHMDLTLKVTCKDAGSATALLVDLEKTTASLRTINAHEHRPADSGDLEAILTAGTFRRENTRVYGDWPIPRSFVDAVVGNTY
jgi:hypothetical protein